ncbi:MAG: WD40 repeat domain-containing protein [Promethearchaeota archaeon]
MGDEKSYKTIREKEERNKNRGIDSLVFTPDGKYIIITAQYNAIEIWEIESGNLFKTIVVNKKLNGTVYFVKITPDGRNIITASMNGKLKVFDFITDQLIWSFKTIGTMNRVDVSKSGRYIMTFSYMYPRIHILDFLKRELIQKLKVDRIVEALAISSDEDHFLFGGENKRIDIWSLSNNSIIRSLKTKKMGSILSVVVDSNMKYIVSGAWNKKIRVWDFLTGDLIRTIDGHTGWVNSVIISPDDKYIISGSLDKTIKIWELTTGQLVKTFKGHNGSVNALALSPDGKYIASGSSDMTIKIWLMI